AQLANQTMFDPLPRGGVGESKVVRMTREPGPLLESIARWVVEFDPATAPARLDGLLEAQLLSVAAATAAGTADPAGQRALAAALRWGAGEAVPMPGGVSLAPLAALDVLTTWSMVHDYDDYLFMGHTGHSAVWVPLVVGAWLGAAP